MGLFSGVYYWFPKFTGRFLSESIGKLHFWLFFIGLNLTFFPMHFLGVSGMPRRIYTYDADLGWETWNFVATVGAFVIAAGMLAFLWNFVRSMREEPSAPDNPWDAPTLEWATSSPPPEHDFDAVPLVRARDPLWHDRDNDLAQPERDPNEHIHLPPPSYYPLLIAVGFALVGIGALSHLAVLALGAVVIIYGVWGWVLEPTGPEPAGDAH
jgi:cytochrome c oxidase subunit 1